MAFSLAVRRLEIYDPRVAVDHYPAQRFDEDQRNKFNQIAFLNRVHNETLILLEHLPPVRRVALHCAISGKRDAPGRTVVTIPA